MMPSPNNEVKHFYSECFKGELHQTSLVGDCNFAQVDIFPKIAKICFLFFK